MSQIFMFAYVLIIFLSLFHVETNIRINILFFSFDNTDKIGCKTSEDCPYLGKCIEDFCQFKK
ncbi:Nodule Cysteine-Rich (NCR) secreted peptide [Medicago truncatula]|uniref:Nodule Cysteine-Rich (NCR) secreted peptide n=1 Tax=Medicago truncatula TaxID=3880 RepID=A0A072TIJ0_MEDTR|nr:Nodule Cysteine-Rich (NCR) secreted peptide [Medicago truncatula]